MLYLNPPFHIINGVSLFSDHEDPLQWYYLPIAPKLTQIMDPDTGVPVPQIQLLKFRGEAGNGGFLNFDVNLALEPGLLEDLIAEIKRIGRLRETPRLAPVPLVDGTVKVILFDAQTGEVNPENPEDPENPQPRFVSKIYQAVKPALYGDNQATFSIQLTQEGVTALEKALQGELSPIGIVYSLDFLALRPAYSVRLNVDWDRVQKHFDEKFGTDLIFFSSEIEKAIDELMDQRVIDLQVDTFVPEGEDTSGIVSRRDQAVNEVRDMITNAFFEPSLNPIKEEEDNWDKVEHMAKTLSVLAASGGWAGVGSFTYRKVDYTRIDRKILNVNMSERTTVKRSVFPQGHLSGLFRVLHQPGMDIQRFILEVDLDDPWFARRQVTVIPRANFEEDGILSINVNLRYSEDSQNVILDSAAARPTVDWASRLVGGKMEREVTAGYQVTFRDGDGMERPLTLKSPEWVFDNQILEINPRELYSLIPIPIIALNLPWERYSHVEVQTRYEDEEHQIRIEDSFLLEQKQPERIWKIFAVDPRRNRFQYRIIYRAVNHKDVEMPWVETSEERIMIRDPFPQKRTLEMVPALDWTKVDRAFVDVTYEDPDNQVWEEESFEFSETNNAAKRFNVDLVDPNRRLVKYQVTVMFKDDSLVQVPTSYTLDRRIFVRHDMKGHKIVVIRPPATEFAVKNIKEMLLEIRYEDSQAGLSYADTYVFKTNTDQAHFEFDYVDEAIAGYEYRITYRFTNGLWRMTYWEKSDREELILSIS